MTGRRRVGTLLGWPGVCSGALWGQGRLLGGRTGRGGGAVQGPGPASWRPHCIAHPPALRTVPREPPQAHRPCALTCPAVLGWAPPPQRFRICKLHANVPELLVGGEPARFCQRVGGERGHVAQHARRSTQLRRSGWRWLRTLPRCPPLCTPVAARASAAHPPAHRGCALQHPAGSRLLRQPHSAPTSRTASRT